ncbi:MAG: hypothetical protein EHM55_15255 [Acidobacteria bacterium]|nr:MAG: hypothetical protein EHM55_15255 [Acidobacteriota bacterium]
MRFENRLAPTGSHLSDDQLLEVYVLAGDNRHLHSCRQCTTRFDELVRSLRHMHEAAVREADSTFTAERLQDQRERIMRRIERHDHPAEVVAFPQRTANQPAVHRLLGPARRWVAAAAAAGLAAGMFLGFAMDRRIHYAVVDHSAPQSAPAPARQAELRDDQFFLEVEAALVGSRVREMRPDLGAIDLMTTPLEIREVTYVRE